VSSRGVGHPGGGDDIVGRDCVIPQGVRASQHKSATCPDSTPRLRLLVRSCCEWLAVHFMITLIIGTQLRDETRQCQYPAYQDITLSVGLHGLNYCSTSSAECILLERTRTLGRVFDLDDRITASKVASPYLRRSTISAIVFHLCRTDRVHGLEGRRRFQISRKKKKMMMKAQYEFSSRN
jgi:hypothetical protein